ncbi:unnamed protein product [Camellia sinensis]
MENRRPRRSTKPGIGCKKHPKHQQSPGVCSVCLREKLSQLSTTSRINTKTKDSSCSSLSSLSSLSSHYSSSESSPVHDRFSLGSEANGLRNVLRKSKSMAVVNRTRDGEGRDHGKKKDGFWSKFLRPRRKKIDGGLMHSRTMRERVITTTSTRVH